MKNSRSGLRRFLIYIYQAKPYIMYVIKRDGRKEPVHFDKITARISKLSFGLNSTFVMPHRVAQAVIQGLYDGVTTTELDELAARTSANMTVVHPNMPF